MCETDGQTEAAASVAVDEGTSLYESNAPKQLDWADVTKMLGDKLTVSQIESSLK